MPIVPSSPKLLIGQTSRKRKTQQSKTPNCRRKLTQEQGKTKQKGTSRSNSTSQRDEDPPAANLGSQNSDDQPICNMIPKTSRRKPGFHTRADPAP